MLYIYVIITKLGVGIQDKLLRTLVLTCLRQSMTSYLARLGLRIPQEKVHKWLAKVNKPILLNLRKGNFSFAEQQARTHALTTLLLSMRKWQPGFIALHSTLAVHHI